MFIINEDQDQDKDQDEEQELSSRMNLSQELQNLFEYCKSSKTYL
jgi:hypothetical protein